jgi:hypothetical protein
MHQGIKKLPPSKRYFAASLLTKSWHPVNRNGWYIKFSTYDDSNVLLTITSKYTGQCIIRHFSKEEDAVLFINMVLVLDAHESYEF